MEVFSPGTKNVQNYLLNRMLVYIYREFRARESPGIICQIRADELPIQSPLTDAIVRKRLKHCAELKVRCLSHMLFLLKLYVYILLVFSHVFFSSFGPLDLTKIKIVLHVYFQKGPKGHFWIKRPDFQVPSEEELKRLLAPESVSFFKLHLHLC